MSKGGISSSSNLHTVIRSSALYVSLLISLYTFGFSAGYIALPTGEVTPELGYTFAVLWAISGIVQYLVYSTSPVNIFFRLTWYQILAALYLSLLTGLSTFPFVTCWMILAIASYAYYQLSGYVLSIVILWFATILNSILYATDFPLLTDNLNTALSITVTMTVILLFFKIQERDDEAFESTRREERRQRESLLTLVNNLTDAIISTNKNGVIKLYNASTVNLLDTNIGLENSKIDDVLSLENEAGKRVSFKQLLAEASRVTINDQLRAKIGDELVRLELTYSPIRGANDQTNDSYIIIMRDITKTKSLEEERDEFISVVSHELRTPIAITEGAIDNAQVIFDKDDAKKDTIKQTLHLAHEQVVFLARMVNDLSTLSRAERGVADEPEIIDVTEMAHALHSEYAPQAEAKGLKLHLTTHGKLGEVSASRLYLHELLQNFITNAIKYTKAGTVELIISKKGETLTFAVKDTGIGISRGDLAKIFEKFYRSEDYRTRETGGTGLGLYVARKLSKKLGCTIDVKSRLNHGSTFSFTLPAYDPKRHSS